MSAVRRPVPTLRRPAARQGAVRGRPWIWLRGAVALPILLLAGGMAGALPPAGISGISAGAGVASRPLHAAAASDAFAVFGAFHHTLWTRRDGAPADVAALAQDADGSLWLGSREGLVRFDGDSFERIDKLGGDKLPPSGIGALAVFGDALWLAWRSGGAAVFRDGRLVSFGSGQGLPPAGVTAFARDAAGAVWAGAGGAAFRFDGVRWHAWRPGAKDGSDGAGAASMPPPALSAGPPAAPADRALFTGAQGMSGATVHAALLDREGNRWYGTSGGLDRIRPNRMRRVRLPAGQRPAGVLAAAGGAVYVGVTPAGVADAARAGGTLYRVTAAGAATSAAAQVGAAAHEVVEVVGNGALWLASPAQLLRLDDGARPGAPAQTWSWPSTWSGADVQALAVDGDGAVWAAVAGHGLWTFSAQPGSAGASRAWRRARADLAAQAPAVMTTDGRGVLWFAWGDGRIAALERGRVRFYGAAQGLPAGRVFSLLARPGGLWIGGENGLGLLAAGRYRALRVRAQERNDNAGIGIGIDGGGSVLRGVAGLAGAGAGADVWALDENGLHRIPAAAARAAEGAAATPAATDITVPEQLFNEEDGMDGTAESGGRLPALAEGDDGRIWYATGASVGWIDARHPLRNAVAPPVAVRAVVTDTGDYAVRSGELTLPQGTRNAQIVFTAAALAIPERAAFRYRLRGADEGWRDPGRQRSAFYTGLAPGDYRFDVVAANEDGVWNLRGASLRLRILPSWYQTPWCRGLAAAGAALLVYALYCWRVRQLTHRVGERLRERIDERERIARALHDTLLQGVQALALRCQTAINRLEREAPARIMIERALDDADRLMEEARGELSVLRGDASGPCALPDQLSQDAQSLGQGSAAAFSLTVEGVPRPLKSLAQQEIHGIAREALANAFRHAAASRIGVVLHFAEERFSVTIRDDGVGIEAALAEAGRRGGHWGLPGMRERAASLGGSLVFSGGAGVGGGVTVLLTVPARRAYRDAGDRCAEAPASV